MFREYWKAFVGAKALDKAKERAPRNPLRASLRGSIPIRSQRSRRGDSKGEAAERKIKKAKKTALVKMKFKELSEDLNVRALVFYQYPELDDEILPKQVDCFFRDARNSRRCRETHLN